MKITKLVDQVNALKRSIDDPKTGYIAWRDRFRESMKMAQEELFMKNEELKNMRVENKAMSASLST